MVEVLFLMSGKDKKNFPLVGGCLAVFLMWSGGCISLVQDAKKRAKGCEVFGSFFGFGHTLRGPISLVQDAKEKACQRM